MPIQLDIEKRVRTGSREARRLRRAGKLPGVIYGKKGSEESVKIDIRDFMTSIGFAKSLGIVELMLEEKPVKSIIKEVQWDTLTDKPVHVDFQMVSDDQMVTVPVPVHLEGTPQGVLIDGGILDHAMYEVMVTVRAADIPHGLTFSVEELRLNERLHLSEVELPQGISVDLTGDPVIASVIPPKTLKSAESEEEGEEGEEGEAGETASGEASEEASE